MPNQLSSKNVKQLIVAKQKFLEILKERRLVINYTVNNFTSISTANIKQLHVEGIISKLDELINTTHSTIKLLYERRTALIEAVVSGRQQVINYSEFQIALRLVNTAYNYRKGKGDRRALLELPIEERNLLEEVLGINEGSLSF